MRVSRDVQLCIREMTVKLEERKSSIDYKYYAFHIVYWESFMNCKN